MTKASSQAAKSQPNSAATPVAATAIPRSEAVDPILEEIDSMSDDELLAIIRNAQRLDAKGKLSDPRDIQRAIAATARLRKSRCGPAKKPYRRKTTKRNLSLDDF